MKGKSSQSKALQPSTKRVAANRLNAQKSTGPRTAEGKAKSSLNAVKYGFYAQATLLPGEDPSAYDALLEQLGSELRPQNGLEAIYVREIVDCTWRLQRLSFVEGAVFLRHSVSFSGTHCGLGFAFLNDAQGAEAFPKLASYEGALARRLHKSMEQLRKLRDEGWKEPMPIGSEPAGALGCPGQESELEAGEKGGV